MSNQPEQLVLYTQTGCGDSRRVRAWLAEHGVPVIERNVIDDPAAAQTLAGAGVFATPLLVASGRHVLGFRPDALAELLGR